MERGANMSPYCENCGLKLEILERYNKNTAYFCIQCSSMKVTYIKHKSVEIPL